MRRRDFIAVLGAMAGCPLVAGAQQTNRVRRIGVLAGGDENGPLPALIQALADLGWTDGRNVRMDVRRWLDIDRLPALAQELVSLQPDIIL
jgi:putative ABC transport system substrate-binding protein